MSVNNIRYWDAPESNISSTDAKGNNTETVFEDYSYSFDSALFDLFGQSNSYSQSLYSNSFFGYDLNSAAQIRKASIKAKEMGMEKVLAAQLASPLPSYGRSNQDDKNDRNYSYDSLNNIANLTIQLQMARVSKSMNKLASNVHNHISKNSTMNLDEYITSIKTDFNSSVSTNSGEKLP